MRLSVCKPQNDRHKASIARKLAARSWEAHGSGLVEKMQDLAERMMESPMAESKLAALAASVGRRISADGAYDTGVPALTLYQSSQTSDHCASSMSRRLSLSFRVGRRCSLRMKRIPTVLLSYFWCQ